MSILAALAVLASCERKPEFSEVTELGCARNEAVVDAAGGEAIFSAVRKTLPSISRKRM